MTRRTAIGFLIVALCAIVGGGPAQALSRRGERPSSSPARQPDARDLCEVAKRGGYVPAADACFSTVTADVDGDGQPDVVLLFGRAPSGAGASLRAWPETLEVVRASGGLLKARLAATTPPPGIVAVGNVNASSGAEVFVYVSWFSSGPEVAVFSFHAGRLIRAPVTFNFGGDSASRFGFDCVRSPTPEIIQRRYELIGPTIYGRWRLTTDTYAWAGASLHLVGRVVSIHHGWPTGSDIRMGAGCDPLAAYR